MKKKSKILNNEISTLLKGTLNSTMNSTKKKQKHTKGMEGRVLKTKTKKLIFRFEISELKWKGKSKGESWKVVIMKMGAL